MALTERGMTRALWAMTVILLLAYCVWVLVGVFYGGLSIHVPKYFLAAAAAAGVSQSFVALRHKRVTTRELAATCLLLSIMLATVMQVAFLPDMPAQVGLSAHGSLVAFTVFNAVWLLAGYAVQATGVVRTSRLLAIGLIGLVAGVTFGALRGHWVIHYSLLRHNVPDLANVSHLSVGTAAYLLLLSAYAFAPGRMRVLIFITALPVLFVLGGRADLAIFITAVCGYEWLRGVRRSKFVHVAMALTLGLAIVANLPAPILQRAGVSRMLFTNGLDSDSSFEQRQIFLHTDLRQLPDQVAVGDVSRLVAMHGGVGTYIHNLLSAWQFYGVFSFALIIVILLSNFKRVRMRARCAPDALGVFGVLLFISACIGVVIAKAVMYPCLWMALGFWTGRSTLWLARGSSGRVKAPSRVTIGLQPGQNAWTAFPPEPYSGTTTDA